MEYEEITTAEQTFFIDNSDEIGISVTNLLSLINSYFPDQSIKSGSVDLSFFAELCDKYRIQLPSRFSGFRTFKRQIEWFAGRLSFAQLDVQYLGGNHQIDNDASGAPFIIGMPNRISITHAGNFAVAAVSLAPSIIVGIDIERIRGFDHRRSFLGVAFPEEEYTTLEKMSDKEIMTLWTLKESFLKIIGLGFAERLKEVKIQTDGFIYKGKKIDSLKRKIYSIDDHVLSVVYGKTDGQRFIS
jgi:phosphopantetheinyl transferase